MTIAELKRQRKTLAEALHALAQKATLTEAEVQEFEAKRAEIAAIDGRIERLEYAEGQIARVQVVEPVAARPQPAGATATSTTPATGARRARIENPGFESLGELVYASRFDRGDSRLRALMELGTGESGGFAVPDEFDPMLRMVSPQEAIVRPRATVVPAGEAPDAELRLPALNQGDTANMYGGVEVDWVAEGGDKPETSGKLRDVSWKPKEVAAHIVVTDTLLRNWRAAGAVLDMLLRRAILAAEDVAFLQGNGIGRPRGVLTADCLKTVNRAGAADVTYEDLVAMEAEFLMDGDPVFVVNPRVIPKLRVMEDSAGHLIWGESARAGEPETLLGKPVLRNYRSPALGTLGDVLLAAFSHYVVKDGVATQIAASEHVHFKQNKTVVKAFRTVDGAPWLDAPVAQEDGQTYSPFVALDVP